MSRVCFMFATSATVDLDSLPEGVRVLDTGDGNGLTIRLPGEYPDNTLLLRHQGKRTISGTQWQLWLCIPCSLDWRIGAKVARFIRRVALARPAKVRGPWSLRQFRSLYPTVAAELLGAGDEPPLVIAGDEPASYPRADYRPTDSDATNDVEPDPSIIFSE